MFKKDYQDSLKNITPDKYIKQKIQNRLSYEQSLMEKRENEKAKRNPAVYWRLGFTAVVCCVAIVLGIVLIPKSPAADKSQLPQKQSDKEYTKNAVEVSPFKSYNELYTLLNSTKENYYEDIKTNTEGNLGEDFDNFVSSGTDASVPSDSISIITAEKDYSTTNTQFSEVDEADVIKTDGKYIYTIFENKFSIISAKDKKCVAVLYLNMSLFKSRNGELYINGDKAIIVNKADSTDIFIIDITDKTAPKKLGKTEQSGRHISSRMIGDTVFVVTQQMIDLKKMEKENVETFVPMISTEYTTTVCDNKNIFCPVDIPKTLYAKYTTVCSYSAKSGKLKSFVSILGGADTVYCSTKNLIAANSEYDRTLNKTKTTVSSFSIDNGKIEYKTSAVIDGILLNQFAIDEHNGYFRFVTTNVIPSPPNYDKAVIEQSSPSNNTTANSLIILNDELYTVGEITSIAKGEKVYSVRFMGDMAYFVTYREIDPLFSADLSDPENPKILGALKIPGFSSYLHPFGNNKLLGIGLEPEENNQTFQMYNNVKLSMFDISNPKNVVEETKLIIKGPYSSSVNTDHKSILVNKEKNLIGFSYSVIKSQYRVYGYTNGEFILKAKFNIDNIKNTVATRGLYIGKYFYLVDAKQVRIYKLSDFSHVETISY